MSTYGEIQGAISQAQPVAFSGGSNLLHGEMSAFAVTAVCDFGAIGIPEQGYVIDTTQYTNRMQMRTVQTLFVDNSDNDGYMTVYNPTFNQSFALPAGYQGYFPIMSSKISGGIFYVTSTGTKIGRISFLNVLMPSAVWAATITPPSTGVPLAVSDAILDATVHGNRQNVWTKPDALAVTDYSGAIVAGGTPQLVIPASSTGRTIYIQNIDPAFPAESLSIGISASMAAGSGLILAAAASASYPGGMLQLDWSQAIYILAGSTGHKFSAFAAG